GGGGVLANWWDTTVNEDRTQASGSRRRHFHLRLPPRYPGEGIGRDDWIRTSDPLTPSQVRYQAALHPDPSNVQSYPDFAARRTSGFALRDLLLGEPAVRL